MANEPLRLNGARVNFDRTGAVSVIVPYEVHSVQDTATFTPPDPPFNLPITNRSAEEMEVGTWRLELTYEGTVDNAGVNFEDATNFEVELDGSMQQDSIKSHPYFEWLKKRYGWESLVENGGNFGFPMYVPGSAGSATALSGQSQRLRVSPLYGADSYLVAGAVFRLSFTRQRVPDSILDDVGEVVDIPPGWGLLGLPRPRGRNWLKLAPKVRKQGNASRVALEYQLSGPRGINRDVYSFSQLPAGAGGSGGLRSGGLTTGTLTTGGL